MQNLANMIFMKPNKQRPVHLGNWAPHLEQVNIFVEFLGIKDFFYIFGSNDFALL